MRSGLLAVAWFASACGKPAPVPAATEVTGTLTVGGEAARLERCRPGHAVHVFVEIDTTLGVLRFGQGKLHWNGNELSCSKLDRSWGGGLRQDGSAYFRGTLAFRCATLEGELTLDCGQITTEERAELDRNRAAARGSAVAPR
jgi:hypothetical protein